MENKFKVRISRMFHSSCKSRGDIVEKSPFLTRSSSMPAAPLPKPLPRPSICKPRTQPSLHINNACIIISSKEARNLVPPTRYNRESPRESESKQKSTSAASPAKHFPRGPFYNRGGTRYYAAKDDYGKKNKRKNNKQEAPASFSDHEREDERTVDTLFSSMSMSSSESSANYNRASRGKSTSGRALRGTEMGEGSLAVVKKSRDPYGDFRKSMVEMITEKGMFEEAELEELLLCFLSLNSSRHHEVIVRVFDEIWDALHSY